MKELGDWVMTVIGAITAVAGFLYLPPMLAAFWCKEFRKHTGPKEVNLKLANPIKFVLDKSEQGTEEK